MSNPSPKIVILLLNWNGKKDTLECLASLKKVDDPHFQTVVIDNGSTDDSVAVLRDTYPELEILETGANLGFAGGNNKGITWALANGAEWILLLNNDTIVDPQFLKAFRTAAQKQPKAKILGAKIYRYQDPKVIDHLGGFWNPAIAEFESPASGRYDDPGAFNEMCRVDYVCGAALLMHRCVPETIGLLEDRFFLFWEETDFCFRARNAGFEVWTAPQAQIWHKVSASFTGGKPHMHYFWWRSRLLWIERNCSQLEKKAIYKKVIWPELWKTLRHYLIRSFTIWLTRDPERHQKWLRMKAGCYGALDYFRGRFGNCPSWLHQKR